VRRAAGWRFAAAVAGLGATGLAAAGPETAGGAPPAAAAAPGPDLAYGAYQRGHYLTAFKEAALRLQRNPADAAAMTLLAELFNQGLGVRESATEAAGWYRLAAKHGDRHAMATLGLMATDGRGMPADRAEARAWLEKAAAAGEPTAAYNLARLLISPGREAEMARGAELLRIAAAAEIGDAQHALGVLHARGLGGLAPDPAEAARLYRRASRNGSVAGTVEFAIAQFNGDGVPKDEGRARGEPRARRPRRAARPR
jgi:TPR repeat protein